MLDNLTKRKKNQSLSLSMQEAKTSHLSPKTQREAITDHINSCKSRSNLIPRTILFKQ